MTDGARATEISERRWAVVDHAGVAALARRQPLTVEGEDIGSFDLVLACGAGGDSYDVSYVERRHNGGRIQLPAALGAVTMTVGRSRPRSRWCPRSAARSPTNSSLTPPARCRPR